MIKKEKNYEILLFFLCKFIILTILSARLLSDMNKALSVV